MWRSYSGILSSCALGCIFFFFWIKLLALRGVATAAVGSKGLAWPSANSCGDGLWRVDIQRGARPA